MRRIISTILLALGLLIPSSAMIVAPASPAAAGQDFWSTDACRPDVWWYNQSGVYGTHYWRAELPQTLFVGGERMAIYQTWGYQCGALGAPMGAWDGWTQWFQEGAIYFDGNWGCMRVWLENWGYSGCGGAGGPFFS